MKKKIDIAVLGHITKDRIIFEGIERTAPGGAVYYCAFPLQRMGISTGVLTKLAEEDWPLLDEFKMNNIQVIAYKSDKTTEMENIYPTKNLDKRICKASAVAESFTLKDIQGIEAKIFHIGALTAKEVSIDIISELSKKTRLSLDAQGFTRNVVNGELVSLDWKEKIMGLGCVDILKADSQEAAVLTGKNNLEHAAKELAAYGPREILITSTDGVFVYADKKFYHTKFLPREIKGRTGRGDTCIAAYIGRRLTHSPEEACRFAAALTSIKLETPGPFDKTLDFVEDFLNKNYS